MVQSGEESFGQMMTIERSGRARRIARKAGVAKQAWVRSTGATRASEGPLMVIDSDKALMLGRKGDGGKREPSRNSVDWVL